MPATRSRKRAASQDDQTQPAPRKKIRQAKTTGATKDDGELKEESAKKTKTASKSKAAATKVKQESPLPDTSADTKDAKPNDEPAKKPKTKGKGKAKETAPQSADEKPTAQDSTKNQKIKDEKSEEVNVSADDTKVETNVADPGKVDKLIIPVDEGYQKSGSRVYIDDKGTIYDASLNQTNAGNNNNKFYRIQLLVRSNGDHETWTRWGRVGESGAGATVGGPDLATAMGAFEKKFKDKSGLKWVDRSGDPQRNKYSFVERDYEPESEKKDDESPKVKKETSPTSPPQSKLEPSVQSLISFIFNQKNMNSAMADLKYDAEKLPLGRLSETTILRAYGVLKSLSALFDDDVSLSEVKETENLSNQYYSFIPHVFGRNRPPVIDSVERLKKEVLLLESLTDLKDTDSILKANDGAKMSIIDARFKGLGLREMTPVKPKTSEYKEIEHYLVDSARWAHGLRYDLQDIFRIEREGESERYKTVSANKSDRRLLWHGSRSTNFGGILSQGLRIAPPEAPVSGYMFGKGIYLADVSSKSAQYCHSSISQNQALLLLCEAELGTPIQELIRSSYTAGEDAIAKGALSTLGQGIQGPKKWKDAECIHPALKGVKMPDATSINNLLQNSSLMYNEYICYDVSQVRLRYLLRVKI